MFTRRRPTSAGGSWESTPDTKFTVAKPTQSDHDPRQGHCPGHAVSLGGLFAAAWGRGLCLVPLCRSWPSSPSGPAHTTHPVLGLPTSTLLALLGFETHLGPGLEGLYSFQQCLVLNSEPDLGVCVPTKPGWRDRPHRALAQNPIYKSSHFSGWEGGDVLRDADEQDQRYFPLRISIPFFTALSSIS